MYIIFCVFYFCNNEFGFWFLDYIVEEVVNFCRMGVLMKDNSILCLELMKCVFFCVCGRFESDYNCCICVGE